MVKLTLDEYLNKRGITRYQLSKETGIKFQIIDNYYKNKVVRYDSDVLDRMCKVLGCNIGDLIRYVDWNRLYLFFCFSKFIISLIL